MQGYRDPPPSVPLLTTVGGSLLALDPISGARLWALPLQTGIGRVVVLGGMVLAATRGPSLGDPASILVIELASGEELRSIEAEFEVTAALARGDRAYFAGPRGLLCVTSDGRPAWRALVEITERAWSGDLHSLVARDPAGRELWRQDGATTGAGALLAIGELVAQVDIDT